MSASIWDQHYKMVHQRFGPLLLGRLDGSDFVAWALIVLQNGVKGALLGFYLLVSDMLNLGNHLPKRLLRPLVFLIHVHFSFPSIQVTFAFFEYHWSFNNLFINGILILLNIILSLPAFLITCIKSTTFELTILNRTNQTIRDGQFQVFSKDQVPSYAQITL